MQRVISWNVASVRARLDNIIRLIEMYAPDILFLQEIKAQHETFPYNVFLKYGYHIYLKGQKAFNGVAVLSKERLSLVQDNLLQENDELLQARFIHLVSEQGTNLVNIYAPNGNPPEKNPLDTLRLEYKIKWFDALIRYLSFYKEQLICAGDFNIIENDTDVFDAQRYKENALMLPVVQEKFQLLKQLPLTETVKLKHPEENYYSFWDFQQGAWRRNNGMLLDRCLVSTKYAEKVLDSGVLKEVRGWEKTSDHAPIFCDFEGTF